MTDQHKMSRIERYQAKQMDLFQVNEHVECYFVEENKEEENLQKLFTANVRSKLENTKPATALPSGSPTAPFPWRTSPCAEP
jgi:hypothetical protein